MTLIVLLILAGVSLSGLFSEKGLFKRTENASNRYNESRAREMLETVLLVDGQYEKNTNPEYNQDEFLDALIKSEIPGSDVKGDVAIIGEYAYELDRSVPKIGTGGNNGYLGNEKDLFFPDVTVAEITHADKEDNYRTAKIEITATINQKAENGINRIELWQNGAKQATITCNNEKTVTTEYRVNRNGVYTIKVYAKILDIEIADSAKTTVLGIVPTVEFSPNGNTTYQKAHTTTVKVKETAEIVTEMKYLWKKADESEPQVSEFEDTCTNNSQITGKGETMTGKYHLWVLVTLGTETNQKTYVNGSDEFYFDNEGPEITEFTATKYSIDGITLSATAQDTGTGIVKFEFYIDDTLKSDYTQTMTATRASVTKTVNITGLSTGIHSCKIIAYDIEENYTVTTKNGTTKLYVWDMYNVTSTTRWEHEKTSTYESMSASTSFTPCQSVHFGEVTGPKPFNASAKINMLNYYENHCTNGVPSDNYTYLWIDTKKAWHVKKVIEEKYPKKGYEVFGDLYEYSEVITYNIGDSKNETITDSNINKYPENGRLGLIWYIRRSQPE